MKQIYRIIFIITLLVTLAGCNDVVFLEPLEAPATEYALPHYGGGIEIDLSHGDYVLENLDNLKSRYIATIPGGEIDKLLKEKGAKVMAENETIVIYKKY